MFRKAQILSKLLPIIISGAAHGQLQASGGSQQVVQDETGRGGELLLIFLSTLTLSSKNVDYALKAKIKKMGMAQDDFLVTSSSGNHGLACSDAMKRFFSKVFLKLNKSTRSSTLTILPGMV